ncbi:polysaccharide deacetylase family protein [Sorangium sp. So ce1389]|uniref:polysaccharide deacetylase family protein n=1 Tax=Sorangium sp. So ce1389 TaxID=3133336 RepID=UPI003F62837B
MRTSLLFPGVCAIFLVACGGDDDNSSTAATTSGATSGVGGATSGAGGSGGSGGGEQATTGASTGGSAGGDGGGGGAGGGESGLPTPPGDSVPKPSGAPGNLVVLPWAGFKAAVTYTFDDAQPSHIAHYDALQAEGIPMTFYVNSGRNDLANFDETWTKAVQDGHELGNHTAHHCHADMTECAGEPAGGLIEEIDECTDYIVSHYGQSDVWTMASPFGDTGWNEPAKSRFFLNRGVQGGTVGPNDNSDPWNLPTVMANGGETVEPFTTAIDSVRSDGKWVNFLFHTILPTEDHWYADVELTSITDSMKHAKGLKDVWIDTMVNIGAYWVGQKVLAEATSDTSGDETIWTWTLPEHFPTGKYLRVTVDGGTLTQGGNALAWNEHGYYEIALDAGTLTLSP